MQCPQLHCRLRPEIRDHKNKRTMLEPGQHACCDSIKEWRRLDNNDVGATNILQSEKRSQAAKGKLRQNSTQETFIWADIAPYTNNMHPIKGFTLYHATTIQRETLDGVHVV